MRASEEDGPGSTVAGTGARVVLERIYSGECLVLGSSWAWISSRRSLVSSDVSSCRDSSMCFRTKVGKASMVASR